MPGRERPESVRPEHVHVRSRRRTQAVERDHCRRERAHSPRANETRRALDRSCFARRVRVDEQRSSESRNHQHRRLREPDGDRAAHERCDHASAGERAIVEAEREEQQRQSDREVARVLLRLGAEEDQRRREHERREHDRNPLDWKKTSCESPEEQQRGHGAEERKGAQRELVRPEHRDDEFLDEQVANGRSLLMPKRCQEELAQRSRDDVGGERCLVRPQRAPAQILPEPHDDAHATSAAESAVNVVWLDSGESLSRYRIVPPLTILDARRRFRFREWWPRG